MGALLTRLTVLENQTNEEVKLWECEDGDPNGNSFQPIRLQPMEQQSIKASKFQRHSEAGNVCRTIKAKRISHGEFERHLMPQDFVRNIKLTFFVNDNGRLDVRKVRDPRIYTELRRTKLFSCFGCLGHRIEDHESGHDQQASG